MAKVFRPIHFVSFGLMIAFYIGLRFWDLTASCLWFDEIFSVHAARHDWSNLFRFVAQDLIHPPFFYVLLKIWIAAGGESLFWLRLFPVVFSVAAIYPYLKLCGELISFADLKRKFWCAWLALLFFAANGALIKYAQEVRMYSLFLCLALFSMWLFLRYLRLGKNIWVLTAINLLLIYTHYFGFLLVFSEIAAILVLQRIKIGQMAVMFGILLAGFAPWVFAVWKAAQGVETGLAQNIGWIERPTLSALAQFVFDLVEPFYFQQSSADAPSVLAISIPILLIALAACVIYLADWTRRDETERRNFILLMIFIKLPVALAFLASWTLPYSVWGTRHLIVVFAPLLILTAIVLSQIKPDGFKMALIGIILSLFGGAFYLRARRETSAQIWCAWENLAQHLSRAEPQKIYVFEDLVAYQFWFALRETEQNFEIVKVGGVEGLAEDKAYFLPRGFDKVRTTDEDGIAGERFFVAFRDSDFNEKHPPLRNLIDRGYRIGAPKVFETPGLKGFLVEVWR